MTYYVCSDRRVAERTCTCVMVIALRTGIFRRVVYVCACVERPRGVDVVFSCEGGECREEYSIFTTEARDCAAAVQLAFNDEGPMKAVVAVGGEE